MNTIDNLEVLIELIPDLVFFKNLDGIHTYCNEAFLQFIQKSRKDVIGKTDFEIYSYENALQFTKDDASILQNNEFKSFEEKFVQEDQFDGYFQITKQLIYDDAKKLGIFCIARDITLKKHYEFIYEDNQVILEYIAKNDALVKNLDKIVHLAEERNIPSKCSILLLTEDKKNLLSVSAPSLPTFYNDAINGLAVGENVGSCGSASFKQERVIIENIDTHKNWQPFLALTQKANLHACWSEPIFSSKGEILGTFAIYNDTPKQANDFELKLISSYAHLASVAIEKEEYSKKLKQNEQELSQLFNNALVGLMYITKDRILIKCNQYLADIFAYYTPEEMIGLSMRDLHKSDENFEEFGKANFQTLKYKENHNIEYELQKKDGSIHTSLHK